MMYTATAIIKKQIFAAATVKNKITATAIINTLAPISQPFTQYNLIDAGQPQTNYIDMNLVS